MGNEKDVLVCGSFGNGANTLIDCLLDTEIIDFGCRIWNFADLIYTYSPCNKTEFFYEDNHSEQVNLLRIEDYCKNLSERTIEKQDNDTNFYQNKHLNTCKTHFLINSERLKTGIRFIKTYKGFFDESKLNVGIDQLTLNSKVILFVLNAARLFSEKEKEFINENFADKKLRNVFFIVNGINENSDERFSEVASFVERGLESAFIDESGKLDKELYNKRVFFLDANETLKAKKNGNIDDLYKTNFINFENTFLDTLLVDTHLIVQNA